MTDTTASQTFKPVGTAFMLRVFYGFCVVAFLSFAISVIGKTYGRSISLGGHSDSHTIHEIVIGNNVISAPENMIRYKRQRRSGVQARLDLYAKWPEMTGYNEAAADTFNYVGKPALIFMSFEEQVMSRDMSGRFEPIYNQLVKRPGRPGPAGLSVYNFKESAGYGKDRLVVGQTGDNALFVARCSSARDIVATCERDIRIGDNLILAYRFPVSKVTEWRAIEAAVTAKARKFLKTGG